MKNEQPNPEKLMTHPSLPGRPILFDQFPKRKKIFQDMEALLFHKLRQEEKLEKR